MRRLTACLILALTVAVGCEPTTVNRPIHYPIPTPATEIPGYDDLEAILTFQRAYWAAEVERQQIAGAKYAAWEQRQEAERNAYLDTSRRRRVADAPPHRRVRRSTATGQGVWDRLAQCEASGNWAANTGNGFSGGLQFTASTWRAYGGAGLAWQNSREAQIAVAERVLAGQGWGAWPACSRRLGLR